MSETHKYAEGVDFIFENVEGEVRWFAGDKGTGMIIHPGHPDCFFHYTEIQMEGYKSLTSGDKIRFDVVNSGKGHLAVNIKKI